MSDSPEVNDDYIHLLKAAFDEAMADIEGARDALFTALTVSEIERSWIIPKSHRPSCPISNKPCTSWSCVFDVCVGEPLREQSTSSSDTTREEAE